MSEENIREIAYIAWQAAANAHRLYPKNKHTFAEFWRDRKFDFNKYRANSIDSRTPDCPKCRAEETFEREDGCGIECAICGNVWTKKY